MTDWTVTDRDRELFERELNSFVPAAVFDAHSHGYRAADECLSILQVVARRLARRTKLAELSG